MTVPEQVREWRSDRPLDLHATLCGLRRGRGDPSLQISADGAWWRTTSCVAGPASLRLYPEAGGTVHASAWGPGAATVLATLPDLLGEHDDDTGFRPTHPVLSRAARRFSGYRVARTGAVLEALVPAVLEQKVVSRESWRAWRWLLMRYGGPAPGPAPSGMRVPPSAVTWLQIPTWDWHRAGVEPRAMATIRRCAQVAGSLEQTLGTDAATADRTLRAIPGVGVWTSAEVRQRAHGDPDAVSVGDYHLPAMVGWALTGLRVDDAGMLRLLAEWPGHRYRAVRLIELSGMAAPRHGPRMPVRDYRRL